MAANQQIIVSITGDSTGIQKAANSGAAALQRFNQNIARTAAETQNASRGMVQLRQANGQYIGTVAQAKQVVAQLSAEKARLRQVEELLVKSLKKEEVALLRASGMMQGMAHAGGSASFALLSLTQGIQDAGQFGMGMAQGIRAVNNNLQQFVTAAVFAAQQAGGAGKALRQMGRALIGPAGLLLAFSAVSAGIEWYSNRVQKARKDTEDASRAWEDAASNLFTFQDALSGRSFTIPESAVSVLRKTLEDDISAIDRLIEKSKEVPSSLELALQVAPPTGSVTVPNMERVLDLTDEQIKNNEAIVSAQEQVAALDMDRIEGQRQLLAMLKQQEGFLDKRNELLEIAKGLGLDFESTSKRTLTTIQKLTEEYEGLVKAFSGSGDAERQEGALRARIELLESLQDATIDYSYSIEQMRLLMSQEGVEVSAETARLREQNAVLQERIRLRREILMLETVSADRLRTLSDVTVDAIGRERDAIEARREAEARAMEQRIANFNKMGADLISSIAAAGGGMDEFHRMFGNFLTRWGRQLVAMGLAQMKFGAAIEAIRAAIKTPGGGFVAIAAGAALVAIGRSLRSKARSAATAGGGGGGGRMGSAPAYFDSGSGSAVFTGGNGVSSSLFPQPGLGTGSGSPITLPGLLSGGYGGNRSMRIQLVASGRDLVGAVDSELIASGRSSAGSPFVSVGAGVITGGSRGDFDGLI